MKTSASERLIASIQIEAFAHATEDPLRVKQALMNLGLNLDSEVQTENLRGHFDNPILLLRLKITESGQVEEVLKTLREKLNAAHKQVLGQELNLHLDEKGSLFLRLDKQELYQSRLILTEGSDVVKLRLVLASHLLRKYKPAEVYRLCGLTA